jgi:single-strand DNA-binding protein
MINKVNLIGRVGKDPEIKHLQNENSVANFTIATSKKFTNKSGEKKETTQWHNIVIWGKLCNVVEKYVKKGDMVCLFGEIEYRNYENKEGQKVYITEIVCDELVMLGGKKENTNSSEYIPYQA